MAVGPSYHRGGPGCPHIRGFRMCGRPWIKDWSYDNSLPFIPTSGMSGAPGSKWLRERTQGIMNKGIVVRLLFLVLALMLLAGCGGSSAPPTPAPLGAGNLNLIFVVSEDLAYQASGDVNPQHGEPHQSGLTAVAPHGHVPATEGDGDAECDWHLRARTHDPFANGKQLSRHGGTGDDSAVRHAEPDHSVQ